MTFYARGSFITSPTHPEIKRIRNLQRREERERTGLFYADGIRFVMQAVGHGARIHTLLLAPQLLRNPCGQRLARELKHAGVRCVEVTAEVYRTISLSEEPQGLGAVVRQRCEPLSQVRSGSERCWVAVEKVQSSGNLGTIIRTADAVGAGGLILLGPETDPYDPAAVRATMGALFARRLARATIPEFAAWKRRGGVHVVGTSPNAPVDYREAAYTPPLVLLMGSERKGMSAEQISLCDTTVKIPMVGSGDSLNLAVAAGILLYEVFSRQTPGMPSPVRVAPPEQVRERPGARR
ncbi:MAG: RNA methyltransferase [Chloroflexi bacterium]|nr:RNA methyltransferase [Chloroflexota bacterium]